jgi:hypothetical protein
MGNNASSLTAQSSKESVDEPAKPPLKQAQIPIPRSTLIPQGLISGSPLTKADQFTAPHAAKWYIDETEDSISALQDRSLHLKDPSRRGAVDYPYIQPRGEPSYKNSSKISHSYGPTGLAPLAPLKSLLSIGYRSI